MNIYTYANMNIQIIHTLKQALCSYIESTLLSANDLWLSPLSLNKNTLFTEKSIRRVFTVGIIVYDSLSTVDTFGNYTR